MVAGILFYVVFFGALLFGPAGTLHWGRGWILLGVILVGAAWSSISLYRASPELFAERYKPPVQAGQPLADKVIVVLAMLTFFAAVVFIPLDVFRLHLLPHPAAPLSILGIGLFVFGWWIMSLALLTNAFAVPVVKHQETRQHQVIDQGVYAVVRHPMYAGVVPLLIGMALWLESWAAVLFAIIPIAVLALRIANEERFLEQKLSGYREYTKRVRYRLIPFVW